MDEKQQEVQVESTGQKQPVLYAFDIKEENGQVKRLFSWAEPEISMEAITIKDYFEPDILDFSDEENALELKVQYVDNKPIADNKLTVPWLNGMCIVSKLNSSEIDWLNRDRNEANVYLNKFIVESYKGIVLQLKQQAFSVVDMQSKYEALVTQLETENEDLRNNNAHLINEVASLENELQLNQRTQKTSSRFG